MNMRKLLKKAKSYLNEDERKRSEKRKYLSRVIKKLKNHEHQLAGLLEKESDKKTRTKLKDEIALTHAQRKKGLKMLKKIKQDK
jgi:hypothetical protein